MTKMINIFSKFLKGCIISLLACLLLISGAKAEGECTVGTSSTSGTKSASAYAASSQSGCLSSMPVDVDSDTTITSLPGTRNGPNGNFHCGMDVQTAKCSNPKYNAVYVPADGKVHSVVWNCADGLGEGAGNYVVFEHPLNSNNVNYSERKSGSCTHYYTWFMHLSDSSPTVSVGQSYKKGTAFAHVGGTRCMGGTFYHDQCKQPNGKGYAIHMHYEVRMCQPKGKTMNPLCPDNQSLCDGTEGVPVSDTPNFSETPVNPYLSEIKDCAKEFGNEQSKACAQANANLEKQKKDCSKVTNNSQNTSSDSLKSCRKKCDEKYPPYNLVVAETEKNTKCRQDCDAQYEAALKTYNVDKGNVWNNSSCLAYNKGLDAQKKDCSTLMSESEKECEERNKAIRNGTTYCKQTKAGEGKADQAGSCMIGSIGVGSHCNDGGTCSLTGGTCKVGNPRRTISSAEGQRIQAAIDKAAASSGFSPTLIAAIINHESAFDQYAKAEGSTAKGLGQILDGTWKDAGCTGNPYNIDDNVACIAKVLTGKKKALQNLKIPNIDESKILGAYFQGQGTVQNAYKSGGENWINYMNPANQYNPSAGSYIKDITCLKDKVAGANGCASSGGQVCEDFRFDAYGVAAAYGANGGGVDWSSEHQCNIAENYSSIQGCLFCNLFRVVFNTASIAARECHNLFSGSLVTLLAIGLAIAIAMIVLRYVSSWKVVEPALLINELLQKIFIVAFIIVLLKLDVTEFFNMFITPVFTAGFKMASLIISDTTTCDISVTGTVNGIGLPQEMGNSMLCAIYSIQSRLEKMMALGSNSICIAVWIRSYWHIPIFPHMGYLLTGIFLWIIAVVFMIAYPFLLIDSVLQFGIASSLFPVALASSAFKITSKYLNIWKIVNIFAGAMFNFIFLTTVLFILLKGMDTQAIKPIIERAYGSAGTSGFFNLEVLAWFMKDFVLLIFFLFLGKAVLEDIPDFANDYAKSLSLGESGGGVNLGIGRKVGGTAAAAATNIGKATVGEAAKRSWEGTKAVARGGTNFVVSGVRSARHNWIVGRTQKKMQAAQAAAAARGEEFNPETFVASGHTFWGRKTQRRLIQNPDGTVALQSTKKSWLRGRTVTTVEDENVSIRTKEYKDGTKKDTINLKNPYMRRLIKSNGTRNQLAMNDILQNSNLPPEVVKKAILNQMMKERFSGMGTKFSWRAGWPPLIVSQEGSLDGGRYRDEQIKSFIDKNGHEVFEIKRTDRAGVTSVYKWTKGETRDLIEYERIQKNGKSTKWSSDGLLQKKEKGEYNLNKDGTFKTDINTTINGVAMQGLQTSADGKLLDKNGNAVGQIMKNGAIVDLKPEIIGTIEERGWGMYGNVMINGAKLDEFMMKSEDPTGIYDNKDGKLIGHVQDNGNIVDANNQVVGTAEKNHLYSGNSTLRINGAEVSDWQQKDGLIYDKDNNIIGQILENGNIAKVTGQIQKSDLVYDAQGQVLGKRTIQDTVIDADGNITAVINGDGAILGYNNQVVGILSENEQNSFENLYKRSSVEFSHSRAYKGVQIFDDDGRRVHGMEEEELLFGDEDIALYQQQMKRYGDVLQHHRFGR
ncbi:MAG: transglycosylase SLT domain-containing protein [Alphaproteobacteria bacterium]|nr:transglycosylase SLT domain-containing protein [Alphaproteobacteria bacterium]